MTTPEQHTASTLPVLTDYVCTAHPTSRVERLTFAARTVTLGGFGRVTAITQLTLAAEINGTSRQQAEAIIAAAFEGVGR